MSLLSMRFLRLGILGSTLLFASSCGVTLTSSGAKSPSSNAQPESSSSGDSHAREPTRQCGKRSFAVVSSDGSYFSLVTSSLQYMPAVAIDCDAIPSKSRYPESYQGAVDEFLELAELDDAIIVTNGPAAKQATANRGAVNEQISQTLIAYSHEMPVN